MKDVIYNIKITDNGEEFFIKSPLVTGLHYDPFGQLIIIKGFLNFKELLIYKKTVTLVDWALKNNGFKNGTYSNIEISIVREGKEIETILIENAKSLQYIESGNTSSSFQGFEIAIQSKNVELNISYYFTQILGTNRHIIFKTDERNLRILDDYIEKEEVFSNFNTNYRIIEFGTKEYSGNIVLNFNEIRELKVNDSDEFFKKMGELLKESIGIAESNLIDENRKKIIKNKRHFNVEGHRFK